MTGRDEERLAIVASDLRDITDRQIEVIPIDLARDGATRSLVDRLDELGFEPDIVVNNAGLGSVGRFHEIDAAVQAETVAVNVAALTAICRAYVPRMLARRSGAIINVASTAAAQPLPYFAVYAASKAYVVSLGQALWAECRPHGVRVLTICPGPIDGTRFGRNSDAAASPLASFRSLPRERVATIALDALAGDDPIVACGGLNRLLELATRIVPRRLQIAVAERAFCRLLPADG